MDASAIFDIDAVDLLLADTPTSSVPEWPQELDTPHTRSLPPEPAILAQPIPDALDHINSLERGWIGALHMAAQRGNDRIVRLFLLHGTRTAEVNETDSEGRAPLLHAVIGGHESVARLLLAHGAKIGVSDRAGRSPLHWAVLHHRLSMLRLLLEHRAEYEYDLAIDAYDSEGWTPLHMAVDGAFEAGVALLLQYGANIAARARMRS
ncbi:ankyrin repeat-containing domain protein [Aspergillus oleicola]